MRTRSIKTSDSCNKKKYIYHETKELKQKIKQKLDGKLRDETSDDMDAMKITEQDVEAELIGSEVDYPYNSVDVINHACGINFNRNNYGGKPLNAP